MEENKINKKLLTYINIAIIGMVIKNKFNKFNNDVTNSTFLTYSIGLTHSCYINKNYKMKCYGLNDKC